MLKKQLFGEALCFLAENEIVPVLIFDLAMVFRRLGGKEEKPSLVLFEKFVEILIIVYVEQPPIIKPRPF